MIENLAAEYVQIFPSIFILVVMARMIVRSKRGVERPALPPKQVDPFYREAMEELDEIDRAIGLLPPKEKPKPPDPSRYERRMDITPWLPAKYQRVDWGYCYLCGFSHVGIHAGEGQVSRMAVTPQFRKMLSSANSGEVLAPAIRAILFDPKFPGFTIKVKGFSARPPDGYFHPSTHPLWGERELYLYLTQPEKLVVEPFDPHSTMAITQGNFWHEFVQHIGIKNGILKKPPVCPCGCGEQEWYVIDNECGERGHMDGIVDGERLKLPGDESFEFKTMRPSKAARMPRGHVDDVDVLAWMVKTIPEYYAQGQSYMRMSGYRRHRFLILSLEYPFEMREVVMPFDPQFAYGIADKYRRVRQAVADQRMPMCSCGIMSKESKGCPARLICHG